MIECRDENYPKQTWKNSLSDASLRYLSLSFENNTFKSSAISYFISNGNCLNKILLGDLLASFSIVSEGNVDFDGLLLKNINCTILDLSNESVSNFFIDDGYIKKLIVEDKHVRGINIKNTCIEFVEGISSKEGLPIWLQQNNLIESFHELNNLAQIKKAKLSDIQKLFIILTRKIFLQHGNGRKEAALFKGFDSSEQKRDIIKILAILQQDGFVDVVQGREGKLYIPNRKMNARIQDIHNELLLSKDVIWQKISKYIS
jgi:hypothetical protein